jgi:hypothetical protein
MASEQFITLSVFLLFVGFAAGLMFAPYIYRFK